MMWAGEARSLEERALQGSAPTRLYCSDRRGAVLLRPSHTIMVCRRGIATARGSAHGSLSPMPPRRTSALHAHRWSNSGETYFVTCCTCLRSAGLTNAPIVRVVHDSVSALDEDGDTSTFAFTLMPDHLHWLFNLGHRLSLGRVIARLKAQTKNELCDSGLAWQRDFFEHRLRAGEAVEPYGLYVFLNPYRADLLPSSGVWPHWRCPNPKKFAFLARLNPDGTPPAEWIGEPAPKDLAVGE